MIIRVAQRARFVVVEQATVDDVRLSWAALGLLVYLLGRPDGWEIRSEDLGRTRDVPRQGRDAVRSLLRELQAAGYLHREKVRNPDTGRWVTRQVLYERPFDPTEIDGSSELPGMPDSDGESPGGSQDGLSGAGTSGVGEPGVGTPGALTNTEEPIREGDPPPADAPVSDTKERKVVAREMTNRYCEWVHERTDARPPEPWPALYGIVEYALADYSRIQITNGLKGLHVARNGPRPVTRQTLYAEIQQQARGAKPGQPPSPPARAVNDWVDRDAALIAENDRAGAEE